MFSEYKEIKDATKFKFGNNKQENNVYTMCYDSKNGGGGGGGGGNGGGSGGGGGGGGNGGGSK